MSDSFVDNLLTGTNVLRAREDDFNNKLVKAIASNSLNQRSLKQAFSEAVEGIPLTQVVMDEDGFNTYNVTKNSRILDQSERRKHGGRG